MNTANWLFWLKYIAVFLIQILLINNLHIQLLPAPNMYIVIILMFPVYINRVFAVIIAFMLGLIQDVFTQSLGYHAFSACTLMYVRQYWLVFLLGRTIEEDKYYNLNQSSPAWIFSYFTPLIVLYQILWFFMNNGMDIQELGIKIFNSFLIILLSVFLCFSSFVLLFMERKAR